MKGFKNVKAYVDGCIKTVCVGFEGDTILYVGDNPDVIDEEIVIDGILCPGFIDQHIHGANDVDFMSCDLDGLKSITKTLVKEGVTSFVPTTTTFDIDKTVEAVKIAKEYTLNTPDNSTKVVGVHLEGPFIDFGKKGAQNPDYILKPNVAAFDKVYDAGEGLVKMISLAPEVDGMCDFIKHVASKGVTVSAGHTNATSKQLKDGIDCGITCVTHTFNAMSGFTHREIGVVGGSMIYAVYNEIICDGVHVNFDAIKILAKQKPDKLILITDALSPKGSLTAKVNSFTSLGGLKVQLCPDAIRLESGTLAGSILTMNKGIENLVKHVGLPLETALLYATENPAKNLKVFDKIGSITIGKKADFAVLGEDFTVKLTVVDGKIAYLA